MWILMKYFETKIVFNKNQVENMTIVFITAAAYCRKKQF